MSLQTFQFDLGKLQKDLDAMGKQAPAIMARSVNRALTAGKTAMVRAVRLDTGIAQKEIEKQIRLNTATRSDPSASFEITGKRIPLIAFQAKGPEPSRGRGRGVSYRLPSGRGRIPNAFIATVGTGGHRGVFIVKKRKARKRKGAPRSSPQLPIFALRGPSLPHVFEKQVDVFQKAAQESFLKTLAHEIDFANRPVAESGVSPAA